MKIKEANENIGGLSKPGKMPGSAWNIPASMCNRGSKLAKIKGTICSNCYACKNRYLFPNVKNSLHNRLNKYNENPYLWKKSMVQLIQKEDYFRWFDSGDLQSVEMLSDIVEVCVNTPNTKHWLPTRERGILKEYLENNKFPDNLCVRLSADMVGQYPAVLVNGCNISTVSEGTFTDTSMSTTVNNCPVSYNKNIKTCADAKCTNCWDNNIYHINYHTH